MKTQYDYLIVGAGLFGCSFSQQMTLRGKSCLVLDRRSHVAGNAHCEVIEEIRVHQYGPHIFHTSDAEVWAYVNQFAAFNHFVNAPIAIYQNEVYNLPFNMNTYAKLWNIQTPRQAKAIIAEQTAEYSNEPPENLEQQAIRMAGRDIYEKLIRGYTEKQWGRPCAKLPPFIIRRLPLRFTYDNNYYNDIYQGIPIGGYDEMAWKMLEGSDVLLETDYADFIKKYPRIADKTVYSGAIDEFFDYCLGHLEYRTIGLQHEIIDCDNWQGNAVANYTDQTVPFTRIIEHKHFEFGTQPKTVISREYPCEWKPGMESCYPIRDEKNMDLYRQYAVLAKATPGVIFGGRLGTFQYEDMDKIIRTALDTAKAEMAMGVL